MAGGQLKLTDGAVMTPEVQQPLGLFPCQGIEPDPRLRLIKAGDAAMTDAPGIAAAGQSKLGIEVKAGRFESEAGHLLLLPCHRLNRQKGSYGDRAAII
jgi:hypothetical protein